MKIYYNYTSTVLAIIATSIGIYKFNRLVKYENLILIILACVIITDLYAINFTKSGENTSVYYNILVPLQLILTLSTYYWFFLSHKIKKPLIICIAFLGIFSLMNAIFIQNIFSGLASYTFYTGGVLVGLFSYFLWRIEIEKMELAASNLVLWFAAANFLYYGIAVPVASCNNWLVSHSSKLAFPMYSINLVMYGLWSTLIGTGFLWKRKQAI